MEKMYGQIIQIIRHKLKEAVGKSSQTAVAKACKTTPATINRVLCGKRGDNLPFKTILSICVGLDIDLGKLISPISSEKAKLRSILSQLELLIKD